MNNISSEWLLLSLTDVQARAESLQSRRKRLVSTFFAASCWTGLIRGEHLCDAHQRVVLPLLDMAPDWLAVIWVSFFRTGSQWVDQPFTHPDPATTPPVGTRGPHLPQVPPTPAPKSSCYPCSPDLPRPPSPWTPATWGYIICPSLFPHCRCKNKFLSYKTTFKRPGPKTEREVLFFTEHMLDFYEHQCSIFRDMRDQKLCTEIAPSCSWSQCRTCWGCWSWRRGV